MKIFIYCAQMDGYGAQMLGEAVRKRLPDREQYPIALSATPDLEVAKKQVDEEGDLVIFFLSARSADVPWLVDLVNYVNDAAERGAPKLVVKVAMPSYLANPDARLDEALRDAYPTSGWLPELDAQIAYYATFRLVQSGGFLGWRPTRPPEAPSEGSGTPGSWTHLGPSPQPPVPATPPPAEPPAPPAPPAAPEPPAAPGAYAPPPAGYASPYPETEQEQQEEKEAPSRSRGDGADGYGVTAPVTGIGAGRARRAPDDAGDVSTLQFSAYHPNTVAVGAWQTLIAYTYLAAALAQVEADAATFTELGSAPTVAKGQASRRVEQGVELTVEPHMDGVTFSPERESFIWRGDWRRTLFRFSGAAALAGKTQSGWIDIYAGPLLVPVARIDLNIPFHDDRAHTLATHAPRGMIVSSNIHDAVFISYSHRDGEAFRQACEEYQRFGITVYTDQQLPAGAHYETELGRYIGEANVFHLLWSANSAASGECRKEWLAALQREPSERFIKPWFWRQPLSAPPKEFVEHRISFKYEPLRRSLWRPSTWFA